MSVSYIVHLDLSEAEISQKLLSLLPQSRLDRALKYKKSNDRIRSLSAALTALTLVSDYTSSSINDVELVLNDMQPPYAIVNGEKYFLSISHSGKYVAVMVDDAPCGIDVEEMIHRELYLKSVIHHLHKNEIGDLSQKSRTEEKYDCFFFLWTMKEAYVKLLGKGLSYNFSDFFVSRSGEEIFIIDNSNKVEGIACRTYSNSGHYFSFISCSGNDFTIKEIELSELCGNIACKLRHYNTT